MGEYRSKFGSRGVLEVRFDGGEGFLEGVELARHGAQQLEEGFLAAGLGLEDLEELVHVFSLRVAGRIGVEKGVEASR